MEVLSDVTISGTVEHGNAWGRVLGFPTANLPVTNTAVDGVWAGTVRLHSNGRKDIYAAAISIGTRPTYYSAGVRLLEAHLLDFGGDLYGRTIRVTLGSLLRIQEKFETSEQLLEQIALDVQRVREWALRHEGLPER